MGQSVSDCSLGFLSYYKPGKDVDDLVVLLQEMRGQAAAEGWRRDGDARLSRAGANTK
jgi:hypothetical protein